MLEGPGIVCQIAVHHVEAGGTSEGNLGDAVVIGVPGPDGRGVLHDVPHLQIEHEGLDVLMNQDKNPLVEGAVSQLVGAVVLGIQVLVLAGGDPEVEGERDGRHGERQIDVGVARELPLDLEVGVAHTEVARRMVDALGGIDPLPVLVERQVGVELEIVAQPHRQPHRHRERRGGDSGVYEVIGEGLEIPRADRLHLGGSGKERPARVGTPGKKRRGQGLEVPGHLGVVRER